MNLGEPERYELTCTPETCSFVTVEGRGGLSKPASARRLKLYVFLSQGEPVYVGITNQPMRARLNLGWKANGQNGYHGYALRHHVEKFTMLIWFHPDTLAEGARDELETIEAEVVHLIRSEGQWPAFQTEIHFHESDDRHRAAAKAVLQQARTAASLGRADVSPGPVPRASNSAPASP